MVDTTITVSEGHVKDTALTREKLSAILTIVNPTKILEIGFGRGDSAELWLELAPSATVESFDICKYSYTLGAAQSLMASNSRFLFTDADTSVVPASYCSDVDLIFIDGGHDSMLLQRDLDFANDAEIPYILVDDYMSKWFQHVITVTDNFINQADVPYTLQGTYTYDSSDGDCTMALLERT